MSFLKGQGEEKCSACNRTSTAAANRLYLFGQSYDAKRVWTALRWDKVMPRTIFLHSAKKSSSSSSSSSSNGGSADPVIELSDSDNEDEETADHDSDSDAAIDDDEIMPKACQWWQRRWPGELTKGKESKWVLSGHCRGRTQLYHTLLHYKLRLLLKVREKLERCGGSVGEVMRDEGFVDSEFSRYENLLENAQRGYGGKAMTEDVNIWLDDNEVSSSSGGGVARRGSRSEPGDGWASGGHGKGMLEWLAKSKRKKEETEEGDPDELV